LNLISSPYPAKAHLLAVPIQFISMAAQPQDVWICGECGATNIIPIAPEACPICGATRTSNKASTFSATGSTHQQDAELITSECKSMDNPDMIICCNCGSPNLIALAADKCPICDHTPRDGCKCAVPATAVDNEPDMWDHPNE